ncbi:MAG TPA: glycosyltransferase family 2 protein [Anaerolineales bacterium]|nr:glycosyltransferase family 2 protein [Anaerolineales bacterium]
MKLSIVATLYQSEKFISEFYKRSSSVAKSLVEEDYEIILVNDGSPDDSLKLAVNISDGDPRVIVVDLSRNFGHHKAMMTGLSFARGELIFLIDSDLEEDPEYLIPFFGQMEKESCDVVYGVQERRKGGWFERWSGRWFYWFFKALTGLDLPQNMVTARLMTKRYVEALRLHEEREVFMAGLWYITGFDQRPQIIKKHSKNSTTYTLARKLSLLVNSVTSFTNAPLIGIFYIGVIILLVSMIYIFLLIVNWLFLAKPLSGWTSVIASIWLLGGMVISFIGVVGIYLSKIFSETKRRPYSIVRQVYAKQK